MPIFLVDYFFSFSKRENFPNIEQSGQAHFNTPTLNLERLVHFARRRNTAKR